MDSKRKVVDVADLEMFVRDHLNVKLKKSGGLLLGLSPLTNERTPSFFVDPKKQRFDCYSSGKSGDIFTLVEEYHGVGFKKAIEILCEYYNIIQENLTPEQTAYYKKQDEIKSKLNAVLVKSEKILWTSAQKSARDYALERFGHELCIKFRLGYDDGSIGTDYFGDTGLLSDSGYVFTRNRLLFPVMSKTNSVMTFTGRRLDGKKEVKYLHGKDNPIYKKAKTLYGMNLANPNIHSLGYGILVEGPTDVIGSHLVENQGNAVAGLGTALSPDQAILMSRYSMNWVLMYDGDKAGRKAVVRNSKIMVEAGLNVRVFQLPSGSDPYDYWKSGSSVSWDGCEDLFKYFVRQEGVTEDLMGLIEARIDSAQSTLMKELYAKQICYALKIGFDFSFSSKDKIIVKPKTSEISTVLSDIWDQVTRRA